MGDEISHLTFGSVYKILFLGIWGLFISLGILMLILSVVAPSAFTINGEQSQGIADGLIGLVSSIIAGSFSAAVFALPAAAFIKIFGRFLPLQTIVLERLADYNEFD